jgi:hypothetical protein
LGLQGLQAMVESLQPNMHVSLFIHEEPSGPQVWIAPELHRFVPGLHWPPQVPLPLSQVLGQAGPASIHFPCGEQV